MAGWYLIKSWEMLTVPQASISEHVGKSSPLSAGIFSKSSVDNKGKNQYAFFAPKTLDEK